MKNVTICMTIVLKFQQITLTLSQMRKETSAIVSLCLFFLGALQYACVTPCLDVDQKLTVGRGCLNLLCIFPGGHWIRANIQCGYFKVVCLFKQKTSEGARWPLWKRGRNPATRHRNIDRQKHIWEPSHNRPYRPTKRLV